MLKLVFVSATAEPPWPTTASDTSSSLSSSYVSGCAVVAGVLARISSMKLSFSVVG